MTVKTLPGTRTAMCYIESLDCGHHAGLGYVSFCTRAAPSCNVIRRVLMHNDPRKWLAVGMGCGDASPAVQCLLRPEYSVDYGQGMGDPCRSKAS